MLFFRYMFSGVLFPFLDTDWQNSLFRGPLSNFISLEQVNRTLPNVENQLRYISSADFPYLVKFGSPVPEIWNRKVTWLHLKSLDLLTSWHCVSNVKQKKLSQCLQFLQRRQVNRSSYVNRKSFHSADVNDPQAMDGRVHFIAVNFSQNMAISFGVQRESSWLSIHDCEHQRIHSESDRIVQVLPIRSKSKLTEHSSQLALHVGSFPCGADICE